MSLTPLTPLPPLLEKYIFFALPSMNGPLPAELKFRENTGTVSKKITMNTSLLIIRHYCLEDEKFCIFCFLESTNLTAIS